MPTASEVRPAKWTDLRVLFDNGIYSVVAGFYEDDPALGERRPVLGERWNGEADELGFPNQAGYPVWHVIPHFLTVPILHGLLDELAKHPNDQSRAQAAEILRVLESLIST